MQRNRIQRRQPKLSLLNDAYRCDEIDKFLSIFGLELESMEAHIVVDEEYVSDTAVGYPLPKSISVEVGNELATVHLTEVWLEYKKDKLFSFAVYEMTGRTPTAHLKTQH